MDKLPSALELFRLGLDTVEVAARLNVTEAQASHLIYCERCLERCLAINFERHTRRAA